MTTYFKPPQPPSDILHKRKIAAWNCATIIPNFDQNVWRWDKFGIPIKWSDYGNRKSDHGWELDHIVPLAKGGCDEVHNLQALHWRCNAVKSDRFL